MIINLMDHVWVIVALGVNKFPVPVVVVVVVPVFQLLFVTVPVEEDKRLA